MDNLTLTNLLQLNFHNQSTWLYLIIAAILLLIIVFIRRSNSSRTILTLLRGITILLLISAWGMPYVPMPGQLTDTYAVIDLSDSMEGRTSQTLLNQLSNIVDQLGVIKVLGFASEVQEFNNLPKDFLAWQNSQSDKFRSNSNLENTLSYIRSAPGQDKKVLLISDGNETKGSTLANLPQYSNSMQIFPLLPKFANASLEELKIAQVTAPQIVDIGKAVQLKTSILNASSLPQSGKLVVWLAGKELSSNTVNISAKHSAIFDVDIAVIEEGVNELVVNFIPDDSAYPQSSSTIFISGKIREKLLVLNGSQEDARHLLKVLNDQAFQVTSIFANQIDQNTFSDLSQYSAIVFNNIAFSALPEKSPLTIKEYVQSGGGFLMIGGNNSFGLGGYLGSSIADILPVELVPPQKEKKRLNVAVQLVLDQSGSMKEQSRIEHAKAAAQAVINGLKNDDYIGIIGFSSTPFELFPISLVGSNRERALQRIELMFAGTTTNLMPALDLGRRRLEQAKAGRKHMIILTDGKLPDGIARRPYYMQTADGMRRTGMTLSTFLIGNEYDILLKDMAEVGGGAFYRTNSLSNLPRLFLEDIQVSTGEKTQKEGTRFDVRASESGVLSTTIKSFPNILGYVETKQRKEAQLELVAYANRQNEPLLASWTVGKGRSLAFTSDVSGRWSNMWISWPQFYKFWSDIINNSMARDISLETPRFEYNFFLQGNSLMVNTTVFSDIAASDLRLTIEKPSAKETQIRLQQLAPGHFQSSLPEPEAGTYTLQLFARGTKLTPVKFKLDSSEFGERKGLGFNTDLLTELANKTQGKINPAIDNFTKVAKSTQKQEIDYLFIILALITFLIEIALREFKWPKTRLA